MQTLTYNNIVAIFSAIADAHKQINSFCIGPVWEDSPSVSADSPLYPRLRITPVSSQANANTILYTFQVEVQDQPSTDLSDREEILSDTNLILQDVLRILREGFPDEAGVTNYPPMVWFGNKTPDSLWGWYCDITLEVMSPVTICDVPAAVDEIRVSLMNSGVIKD